MPVHQTVLLEEKEKKPGFGPMLPHPEPKIKPKYSQSLSLDWVKWKPIGPHPNPNRLQTGTGYS